MTRGQLITQIRAKKSTLCVGLDTDPRKLPASFSQDAAGMSAFNRAIIEATSDFAVAYKLNIAFYEAQGPGGWEALQQTLETIPGDCFTIADAKRGDIGNTAEQYATTFFDTYSFDSVTVAPYMGRDSVQPFLGRAGKWAIVLGITSNPGSQDFQQLSTTNGLLYEQVLQQVSEWGSEEDTMFVVGATRNDFMSRVRQILPDHFLLVPGIGAQGGDLDTVCRMLGTPEGGILVNVSRAISYASQGKDFAAAARAAAQAYQKQLAAYI